MKEKNMYSGLPICFKSKGILIRLFMDKIEIKDTFSETALFLSKLQIKEGLLPALKEFFVEESNKEEVKK